MANTKVCKRCGQEKSIDDYGFLSIAKNSRKAECKDCANKRAKAIYQSDPQKHRSRAKQYRKLNPDKVKRAKRIVHVEEYGISVAQYELMEISQDYKCDICGEVEQCLSNQGTTRRLSIDHCHATGKVRSLLCSKCNHGLGNLNDSPELLRRAASYIEGHRKVNG